jgi:MOSC domain-containing protein YiiM
VQVRTPYVKSVNTGRVVEVEGAGKQGRTAIDKRPVDGPVPVRKVLGLARDERGDTVHHTGPDHAVYAYAREDLDWWVEQLGEPLRDGHYGENLTTVRIDVTGAVVGERWRIGTALLEVAGPRIPCVVFQHWMDQPAWVKRFTRAGRPGAYLRVVTEGTLRAGDPVEVAHRPGHGVTIGETFRALTTEPALAERVLAAADPGTELHTEAAAVVARQRPA